MSSSLSLSSTTFSSEFQAQDLLKGIRAQIDSQLEKESRLETWILEQLELATARHSNGSKYGAWMCMNKVQRMRLEREGINAAIDVLETHAMNIEAQLGSVRAMMMQRSGSEISIDLSVHESYEHEVNQVLSGYYCSHVSLDAEFEDDSSVC